MTKNQARGPTITRTISGKRKSGSPTSGADEREQDEGQPPDVEAAERGAGGAVEPAEPGPQRPEERAEEHHGREAEDARRDRVPAVASEREGDRRHDAEDDQRPQGVARRLRARPAAYESADDARRRGW